MRSSGTSRGHFEAAGALVNIVFLRQKIWRFRRPLGFCLALMLLESSTVLMIPWLGGWIAGGLATQSDVPLGVLAVGLIVVLFFQSLFLIVQNRVLQRTAERLTSGLRIELYDHVQRLPLPWLDDQRRGDLLALITREVDLLSDFVTGALLRILPQFIVLIGAVALMLTIDPVLTVPVILGVPAFYLLMKIFGRNIRPLAGKMRDAYAHSVSLADENLSVLQMIKAYTREDLEARRFEISVFGYRDLKERMIAYQSLIGPMIKFLAASSVVLVLWVAGGKVTQGQMGAGDLVSFLLYAGLLTRPVAGLADLWGQFQQARGALRHMSEVVGVPPEVRNGSPLPIDVKGALRFENISFRYPGRSSLLKDLNFEIAAGETVAILGENGAGKSTLIDLLMRFRTSDNGRILLDGAEISTLDLTSYRQAIGLVPQRVVLIDGTIADNILIGRPEASREEVVQAALEAEAWSFIVDLSEGLDTSIGERGIRLSGGQRQRVALARALLKKPAILILDEPTAMFDPESEIRFVETARKALANCTVILVTHRPASLEMADRVLRLRDGGIEGE